MERIYHFPPGESTGSQGADPGEAKVRLHRQHLWIAADIAQQAFGDVQQVYAVYAARQRALLLAPSTDSMFRQAHDCSMLMLKTRNLRGDKSLSLEEFIIDNDLDDRDRDLEYMGAPGLQMLQVIL